jgi:hypothetical protein
MKTILATATFLLSISGFAADKPACVPDDQIQGVLKNYQIFHFDNATKKFAQDTKVDGCDTANMANLTVRAVSFLNQLPPIDPSKSSFTSVVVQEGAANYLQKRIKQIAIETVEHKGGGCEDGVLAYVMTGEGAVMHLCPFLGVAYPSILMVSTTMIHEARHTEGFPHAICSRGPMGAMDQKRHVGACDKSYEEQGSYGIETGFLVNVYASTQNEMLRQEARANAVEGFYTRFNAVPLDIKEGVLLQSQQGSMGFYDGSTNRPMTSMPVAKVISIRSGAPAYFSADGSVKSYYYSKELQDTPGVFARKYRETLTPAQRNSMIDMAYMSGDVACFLFEKSILCGHALSGTDVQNVEIPLNAMRPARLLTQDLPDNTSQLLIIDQDGYAYKAPTKFDDLAKAKESDFVKSVQKTPLVSMAVLEKASYGVDLNGILQRFDPNQKKWSVAPGLNGQKINKALGPFYWSQKLEDL